MHATQQTRPTFVVVRSLRQPQPRQPGRHDKGDRQRQEHAHAGVDWNRAHVRPHQPRHKSHGQERGDHGQRGQDRWAADFVDRAGNQFSEGLFGMKGLVAMNVFDHDDGIVDQNPDRENQCKERDAI